MRLGGYILIELVVGASLAAGAGGAVFLGGRELLTSSTAQAYVGRLQESLAEPAPVRDSMVVIAAGMLPLEQAPSLPAISARQANIRYFHGISDDLLLAPLRNEAVVRSKFNRGGSSVSLRLDFAGGGRAAFKPDQTNLQSIPRKEVAAYRINRMLGLSSVAPAVARAFSRAEIIAAMDPSALELLPRFQAEVLSNEEGNVTGSLAWWIPTIVDAKIDGFLVESLDGMVRWKRYLTANEPIPYEARLLLPQLSDMLVFDYLINNFDRFSGSNIKSSPDGHQLYFMDNALAFSPLDGGGAQRTRRFLERCQKFSRGLYAALRRLDRETLDLAVTDDTGPYDELLTARELDALFERRDLILAYIDGLIAVHGREVVLVFP